MIIATKKGEILKLSLSILKIISKKVEKGPWAVLGHSFVIIIILYAILLCKKLINQLVITMTSLLLSQSSLVVASTIEYNYNGLVEIAY